MLPVRAGSLARGAFLMKTSVSAVAAVALVLLLMAPPLRGDEARDGRYLVVIGGCNDCHTVNWIESGGTLPESDWLTGNGIGFRGPWGTTYPSNLRILVTETDEDAFVTMLHERKDRPPMPWVSVNNMSEADARAVYRFIRGLGSTGTRMPTAVPPGVEPETPYILFEPQHMERLLAAPQSN